MEQKYSISEIVQFAIEIEKEGTIFYQKMSEKTKNQELKDLYLQLKNDEIQHQQTYENMKNTLEDSDKITDGLENEYANYLHKYIENTIFDETKLESLTESLVNDSETIEFAVKKEQESIEYYKNMKNLVPQENVSIIEKIIEEEQFHVIKLLDMKERVS
ncbi:ferritin family protein [bacterium]|nr:ferritin family protein [bacterium]